MIGLRDIRDFWRDRSRLEKAVALLVLAVLILQASGTQAGGLAGLIEFAALVAGAVLAVRYIRAALGPVMWRLRNRLLITYLFIGVIPVLLLLTMAALAAYIFYGQVATYLVNEQLTRIAGTLDLAARSAARDLTGPRRSAAVRESGGDLEGLVRSHMPDDLADLPMTVWETPAPPVWVGERFRGLVRTEDGYDLRAAARSGGRMLVISAPVDRELVSRLVAGIGSARLLVTTQSQPAGARPSGGLPLEPNYDLRRSISAGELKNPIHRADFAASGVLTEEVTNWETGEELPPAALVVTSRPSVMNARLFSTLGEFSGAPLTALGIVAVSFFVIEVLSLLVGVRLTRTITRSVADLYEGTERVHRADFSWLIPVRSRDQLAALAESFNVMTASIRQLIEEQKEKQRLEFELDIARDVQAQLFPKRVPDMKRLEITGLCFPARSVSGDYYDFLSLGEGRLAMAIADIAGKGISAALLMAGIQSMLRAQLSFPAAGLLDPGNGAAVNGRLGSAELVSRLNKQLHGYVAAGHFATFYCGIYNDDTGELTYTNAGHLPPNIIRRGETVRLEKGGMVLGIFANIQFEQETVHLRAGDLLVAFTDGITEPENSYGEEFGEQRLIDIVRHNADLPTGEILGAVMTAVREWSASPEQQDDMTLLVARRL